MSDSQQLGATLLLLARDAIGKEFGLPARPYVDLPELNDAGAVFVTLKYRDALRGCIGSLTAYRPLLEDVRENAQRTAFADPRFLPLSFDELADTRIEVSLLSPPTQMNFRDEADALAQLRPGVDGVIFSTRGRRSTFLPQVWEELSEPQEFLAHLKQKAGLAPDYWSPDVVLERYQVQKWKEAEP